MAKKVWVTKAIALEPDLDEMIQEVARDTERSYSAAIRFMVKEYLKASRAGKAA